jgi:hypothetical protein
MPRMRRPLLLSFALLIAFAGTAAIGYNVWTAIRYERTTADYGPPLSAQAVDLRHGVTEVVKAAGPAAVVVVTSAESLSPCDAPGSGSLYAWLIAYGDAGLYQRMARVVAPGAEVDDPDLFVRRGSVTVHLREEAPGEVDVTVDTRCGRADVGEPATTWLAAGADGLAPVFDALGVTPYNGERVSIGCSNGGEIVTSWAYGQGFASASAALPGDVVLDSASTLVRRDGDTATVVRRGSGPLVRVGVSRGC